ncbi:DUF222 domain-containing protein [Kribbella sp. CWNU-51]
MELLDERPVWSMSGAEMLAALDQLQADLTRRQVRRLELLAALDANGHAHDLGAGNTIHLLSIRHNLDPTDVRRDLRLATALPKYPTVTAALTDGTRPGDPRLEDDTQDPTHADQAMALNTAQAQAIVAALEKVPASAQVPVEDLRVAEDQMVKAAEFLAPGELRKLGVEVRNRLDTDGPEPTGDGDTSSQEALWLKQADHGVRFGGYLAAENAELLQTLIFAGAKPHKTPDGHRDPRPRGKRQADALTAILATAAGAGTAVPGHGDIKPHITVTIDLEDLKSGTGTGRLIHGDTLSAAAVRRLACDAGIIPLVLGSNSEPLDVGTEHRFVTRAIRHALNARDHGCIVCGAPPAICEAHHIIHWADGGTTCLDNFALLCKRDHIAVHNGHLTIQIVNGHPHATAPPGPTPTHHPDADNHPNHHRPNTHHPSHGPHNHAHPPDAATRSAGAPPRALGTPGHSLHTTTARHQYAAPALPRPGHSTMGSALHGAGQRASRGDQRRL